MSLLAPLAGLSAATALTIAGITTNEATTRTLMVVGAVSGAVTAATAREEAEREAEKYEELLRKAREETYSEVEEAEHLAKIAELERRLAEASASAAVAQQRADSLEEENKRQRQVAEKAEKDIKVLKNKSLEQERQLQQLENAQGEAKRKAELEQRLAEASTSKADDNAAASQANGTSPAAEATEDYNREDRGHTVDLRRQQSLPAQLLQVEPEAKRKAREPYPLELLSQRLLEEIPDPLEDPGVIGGRGLSWRAQQLLAQLLPFHHREREIEWRAYLDRRNKALLSPSDLIDDSEAIAEAIWQCMESRPSARTGADIHHFRFDPSQPLKLQVDTGVGSLTLELPDTGLKLTVDAIDAAQGTVSLKLPWSKRDQLIPKETNLIKVPVDISKSLRERLQEQAEGWLSRNERFSSAMVQLLERQPLPELRALNSELAKDPGQVDERLAGFLAGHSGITLALQGPPGTGKTTVAGQVIAQLVKQGKRIAISSNSHAAINHLLKKAKTACAEAGVGGQVVKCRNSKEEAMIAAGIPVVKPGPLPKAMVVAGGTTWIFCREELADQFDLLVIDEAGQMSLANLLVTARCARSILLVGDQQQLAQPSRAIHPGHSGQSCLDYLMQDHGVVPDDRGVFLPTSWRMEPSLTAMVSALFYEGRLESNPGNHVNCITWRQPFQGSTGQLYPEQGLVFDAVEHRGRRQHAPEEIDRIEQLVEALLGSRYAIARKDGIEESVLDPSRILVTAPYNVQVNRLQQQLNGRARVGTVDKFQGQEAPVAIHSLTASSADDAARGLSFLLEPNRLNVAISRAQCLSIVVASPSLLASGTRSTGFWRSRRSSRTPTTPNASGS